MPRRRRQDVLGKVRLANLNNNVPLITDDNSMDDAGLDGDLDECGSPLDSDSPQGHAHHPVQRNAANARERARMRVLSKAFCRLKTTLPWVPADTKLSKLDTLRLATSYIAHLRDVLLLPAGDMATTSSPHAPSTSPNPLNLTWPFAVPGVPGGPEPWISRGASSASSRTSSASSRVSGGIPSGDANLAAGSGLGSGASSNASSSGADDDTPVQEDDGQEHDDSEEHMLSRRGLSGGRLVELQQPCQPCQPCQPWHQPQAQYHPFLHRYVDSTGAGGVV